jgi:hypothetical protein
MVMSPMGLGTKNHYAGEGQQQFSSQSVVKQSSAEELVMARDAISVVASLKGRQRDSVAS